MEIRCVKSMRRLKLVSSENNSVVKGLANTPEYVLNRTCSAECAEIASIVIELIIGNYYLLQTISSLWSKHYKLQQLF